MRTKSTKNKYTPGTITRLCYIALTHPDRSDGRAALSVIYKRFSRMDEASKRNFIELINKEFSYYERTTLFRMIINYREKLKFFKKSLEN
jgi:hypothetical protein